MKTILVVDDKPAMRTLVRDYLQAEGFRVVLADNGRNALFVARQEKPDLILLDVIMPEWEGGEVAARLADDPLLRDVPIVFLTAARNYIKVPPNKVAVFYGRKHKMPDGKAIGFRLITGGAGWRFVLLAGLAGGAVFVAALAWFTFDPGSAFLLGGAAELMLAVLGTLLAAFSPVVFVSSHTLMMDVPTLSLGLAGMRERARLHGGTLEVHSSPGAGTRVIAEVPLAPGRG